MAQNQQRKHSKLGEVVRAYAPLGFITFGGPQAHIALFHDYFIEKFKWVSPKVFSELFSIASALPGPASTQMAYAFALLYAGPVGGAVSFLMWTLPVALIMAAAAIGVSYLPEQLPLVVLKIENGLTSSAIGLTALAAYKLGTKINVDPLTQILGFISAAVAINYSAAWLFPVLMIFGGLVTYLEHYYTTWRARRSEAKAFITPAAVAVAEDETGAAAAPADEEARPSQIATEVASNRAEEEDEHIEFSYSSKIGLAVLGIWLVLLVIAIVLKTVPGIPLPLNIFGTFYFVGSIIFGGGPVVVPLLKDYTVSVGWLTDREFLIGFALINSAPGPQFNFSAFLGGLALRSLGWGGSIAGSILAHIGIFLPGLLLMSAIIPLWTEFRKKKYIQVIFRGMGASAVGLVFAAVYLLWSKAVNDVNNANNALSISQFPLYVAIVGFSFLSVGFLKFPSYGAVLVGGLVGLIEWAVVSRQ
ncbi:chromate transporter-domain-containing protein [Polychytrium aggregatum]|uniref:chromate transporter-domain-containing protein n=1 Tax=Polychytrium aggregatum TaxID=110093 RepID=UPI0022FDBF3F|nr:chromate transporter-domain-containing protein [Polychytrium aggregatum]KAI9204895.1 chromate transporter-domain-containing protein [Polychytrium aggregatum]